MKRRTQKKTIEMKDKPLRLPWIKKSINKQYLTHPTKRLAPYTPRRERKWGERGTRESTNIFLEKWKKVNLFI